MLELPNKVWVYCVDDMDMEYLSAELTAEACAAKGETRLVGVYKLIGKINVTLEVKEELIVEEAA